MAKNRSGFTIVEVTIVVTIIAILAAISIVAYSRVQADARDAERASKMRIIADALEKYYKDNGEYPSCNAMTQTGAQVSANVLVGIDPDALLTPRSPAGTTNSIQCTSLVSGSGPDVFAYVGDGSAACNTGASCLKYTLQYRQETSGTIPAVESLHSAHISTVVVPTLAAATSGSTQINLSWTAIDNAVSYRIQRATDAGFAVNFLETTATGTTASSTGLVPGTTYYFRVLAVAAGSEGEWSNTASAVTTITPPAATPTMTAALSGTNAVGTVGSITCAAGTTTQYQIQYRSTATATMGAWSSWSAWSAGLTRTEAALQGYQYGFQAQARCLGGSIASTAGPTSNIPTIVRPIGTPVAPTYLTPASFASNVPASVNFSGTCPAGTTRVDATFRSKDWLGVNWGPNDWGYSDSWTNTTGSNKNVEYWGKFRCQTIYSTSPYTGETYRVTVVTP